MASQKREVSTSTPKMKAHWSAEFHKLFVSLCLDQLYTGNKPGTYLNKKGWKYVMDEFYKRTGVMYDKKQFKNHWDSTKDQWKVWKKLKSSASDIGWDETTEIVRQSDEWWDDYLQAHPEATQFRYRGLPLADSLDTLFSGISASGTTELTPSQGTMSNFDIVPSQAPSSTENNNTKDIPEPVLENQVQNNQESPSLSQGEFDNDTSVQRKRKNEDPQRFMQWRKREPALRFDRQFGHVCEAVESRSTVTSTLKERYSIKECVDLLNEMEEIPQGSELYMFALDVFLKKEYRELFIVLGTPHMRQVWLKRQQKLAMD